MVTAVVVDWVAHFGFLTSHVRRSQSRRRRRRRLNTTDLLDLRKIFNYIICIAYCCSCCCCCCVVPFRIRWKFIVNLWHCYLSPTPPLSLLGPNGQPKCKFSPSVELDLCVYGLWHNFCYFNFSAICTVAHNHTTITTTTTLSTVCVLILIS